MAEYLIKTFDSKGHVRDRFQFAAPTDQDAEAVLPEMSILGVKELWCGGRIVVARPQVAQSSTSSAKDGLYARLRHSMSGPKV